MRIQRCFRAATVAVTFVILGLGPATVAQPAEQALWTSANQKAAIHRFSTLFTAQDVRQSLSTPEGLNEAVAWCKKTGVTKVYLEVFRSNYQAEREALIQARERFQREGFVVAGCVTTTQIGKRSTGWNIISCYTNRGTQEQLEQIFRYAASLFEVVMIDDFWFTDCECEECKAAKGDQSWSAYRLALMLRMSRERVLGPAREVNPRARLIIKYPEWYDRFHERGYDVDAESRLFDITWIGTETRDPDNARWGKKPQFGAYWISQWTAAQSRGKLGGGWFDPLGTTPKTYVEQARQTILGQCRESLLFCYGALHRDHGPTDVEALRPEIPGLLDLAAFVADEPARGVGTYKPANSPPGEDQFIFNFLGMLGIPMTAGAEFPSQAPSLLLTEHAVADPAFDKAFGDAIRQGKPILMTSSLKQRLSEASKPVIESPQVRVLELKRGPDSGKKSAYGVLDGVRALMTLTREEADALRRPLLKPFGIDLSAPPLVSLYLYGSDKVVIESFRDEAAEVTLTTDAGALAPVVMLPPGAMPKTDSSHKATRVVLPPRSLLALRRR